MKLLFRLATGFLLFAGIQSASYADLTFVTGSGDVTASGRPASATAVFSIDSVTGNLDITLTNNALAANVKTPGDVLTNLEFNLTGSTLGVSSTTPGSVTVATGSSVLNYSTTPNPFPDISNGWVFGTGVTPAGVPHGTGPLDYGVSSTSFISSGSDIRFDGSPSGGNPGPPDLGNIDGSDFGLVAKGTSLTNFPNDPYGLVADTVNIVIPVLSGTLDLTKISNVWFTYGSEQEGANGVQGGPKSPPGVPEPSTLAIGGLGALGFLAYSLRRRRAI